MDIQTKNLINESLNEIKEELKIVQQKGTREDVIELELRIGNLFKLCKLLYRNCDDSFIECEILNLSQQVILVYHDIDSLRIDLSKIKIHINTSSINLN